MPGSAFNHGIVIRDAGFLRGLRDIVDVGPERDHRLPFPPGRDECSGNPGNVPLYLETFFFEDAGEVLRSLELLKAQLSEAEDAVPP